MKDGILFDIEKPELNNIFPIKASPEDASIISKMQLKELNKITLFQKYLKTCIWTIFQS